MKAKTLTCTLTAIATLGLASTSHAGLIAYDGFDGNATGFSAAFSSLNTSGGLGYTDANGNVLDTVQGNSGGNFSQQATLTSAVSQAAGNDVVWVSFIVQNIETSNSELFRLDFLESSAVRDGIGISSQFTSPEVRRTALSPSNIISPPDAIGDVAGTNFYVLKLDFENGLYSAYFNPLLSGVPLAPSSSGPNIAQLADGLQVFDWVFGGNFLLDELRVGDEYSDVTPFTAPPSNPIPEPASLALTALGLAALAGRRRR